jgi:hypothetical protein
MDLLNNINRAHILSIDMEEDSRNSATYTP